MKNILYLAPESFPPHQVSGSIRNTKIVKYFSHHDYFFYVLTTNTDTGGGHNLLSQVQNNCEIFYLDYPFYNHIKKNGKKSLLLRILLKLLKELILVPDQYLLWYFTVKEVVTSKIKIETIDYIYLSAPPFSCFFIGYFISKKFSIPLLLDFRDPWIEHIAFKPKNIIHSLVVNRYEKKILLKSKLALFATEPIYDDYCKRFPTMKDKFHVFTNGYDEDDFSDIIKTSAGNDIFHIVYVGSYSDLLDPSHFFTALKKFLIENPAEANKIKVTFAGKAFADFSDYLNDNTLKHVILTPGYLEHKEAINLIANANLLLLIIYKHHTGSAIMSNKLYEYIGSGNPIIGLVPAGIARKTIEEYDLGLCTDPDDVNGIIKIIDYYYRKWKNGEGCIPKKNSEIFTRRYQVDKIARLLSEGYR